MEGVVVSNTEILVDGVKYNISKYNKDTPLKVGDIVEVSIDGETPESCDNNPFCEGDITCQICTQNNIVAWIKTKK